ncbi:hypothetical protein V8C35DRAFT_279543 [Trichoderma chlorosporum]
MPNGVNFPTSLTRVEPGDVTGIYYITFNNLPLNSTWQEVKDWISGSCPVDFVEVFPGSNSGWTRFKEKDSFMRALAYMETQPFKGRYLIVDGRNRTEPVEIRTRETSAALARFRQRSRLAQSQYHTSAPRQRRTFNVTYCETDNVDIANVTPRLESEDFVALASLMLGMSLQRTLQMQYYVLPYGYPFYNGDIYNGMGGVGNFPSYYDGHGEAESVFRDDDSQSSHS